MKFIVIALALLAPAAAQPLTTIPQGAGNWNFVATYHNGTFVTVSEDGDVTIDWDNVRKAAAQPEHTEWWAIAQALLKAHGKCGK